MIFIVVCVALAFVFDFFFYGKPKHPLVTLKEQTFTVHERDFSLYEYESNKLTCLVWLSQTSESVQISCK